MMDRITTRDLRLERLLDAAPETVWRFVAEPELRSRWFMAGPDDLREGGTLGFAMRHGALSDGPVETPERYRAAEAVAGWRERILVLDPPHRIDFTWNEGRSGTVSIRLAAEGDRTRLVLIHAGLRGRPEAIDVGGGWHSHLEALRRRIAGQGVENFWTLVEAGEQATAEALDRQALRPGRNIAIKVPAHRYDETVAFYAERVGLAETRRMEASTGFAFDGFTLWIDRVAHQSQVDVWLELFADDPDAALAGLGSPERDGLEPLDGVEGHWTSDPAGTVLLVRKEGRTD